MGKRLSRIVHAAGGAALGYLAGRFLGGPGIVGAVIGTYIATRQAEKAESAAVPVAGFGTIRAMEESALGALEGCRLSRIGTDAQYPYLVLECDWGTEYVSMIPESDCRPVPVVSMPDTDCVVEAFEKTGASIYGLPDRLVLRCRTGRGSIGFSEACPGHFEPGMPPSMLPLEAGEA